MFPLVLLTLMTFVVMPVVTRVLRPLAWAPDKTTSQG